eukprot:4628358-Pyramimonas_sp.AAC.1
MDGCAALLYTPTWLASTSYTLLKLNSRRPTAGATVNTVPAASRTSSTCALCPLRDPLPPPHPSSSSASAFLPDPIRPIQHPTAQRYRTVHHVCL